MHPHSSIPVTIFSGFAHLIPKLLSSKMSDSKSQNQNQQQQNQSQSQSQRQSQNQNLTFQMQQQQQEAAAYANGYYDYGSTETGLLGKWKQAVNKTATDRSSGQFTPQKILHQVNKTKLLYTIQICVNVHCFAVKLLYKEALVLYIRK